MLSLLLLALFFLTLHLRKNVWRILLCIAAVVFFAVALTAVITFISAYAYEMPLHHCPFDMLQSHYSYIGYPLYITLFAGVLYGMLPGLFFFVSNHGSLQHEMYQLERKWLKIGMTNILICTIVSIYIIITSNLTMV